MTEIVGASRERRRIQVVVVEEQLLFAEALEISLSSEGLTVTRVPRGLHWASPSLLTAILRLRPAVALIDVDLDDVGAGPRLVGPLSRAGVAVVAVTGSRGPELWGECLRYGARTVLSTACSIRDVVSTVRYVAAGRPVLDRAERDRLVAAYHRKKAEMQKLRHDLDRLSNREQEVLARLREGWTVAEIAAWSCVSEWTVRTQVKSILAKLGVTSQLAAVGASYRAGWSPSPPLASA